MDVMKDLNNMRIVTTKEIDKDMVSVDHLFDLFRFHYTSIKKI